LKDRAVLKHGCQAGWEKNRVSVLQHFEQCSVRFPDEANNQL
jgi:hypothetical protein